MPPDELTDIEIQENSELSDGADRTWPPLGAFSGGKAAI